MSNGLNYHPPHNNTLWTQIEQSYCNNISLSDLPSLNTTLKKHKCFSNTVISTTLAAWWKTLKITNSPTLPCKNTPIWHNPDFLLDKTPIYFHDCEIKGITHLHHLLHGNGLKTFKELTAKYGLNDKATFQYLQLKSILRTKIHNNLEPSKILQDIIQMKDTKKSISQLYKMINKTDRSIYTPVTKWNQDIQTPLIPTFWNEILQNTFTLSTNTNLQFSI